MSEAREFGLLPINSNGQLTREQMLYLLEEVVHRTDITLAVSATTIFEAIRELSELEAEESKVSLDLTSLRRRLMEMKSGPR